MDELFFEGKKYISSKRAARESGYTKDYIGQLCRGGKLDARMVGRSWYIAEDSIEEHSKQFQGEPVAKSAREKLQKQQIRRSYIEDQSPLTYIEDDNPLLPTIAKVLARADDKKLTPARYKQENEDKEKMAKVGARHPASDVNSQGKVGQEIMLPNKEEQEAPLFLEVEREEGAARAGHVPPRLGMLMARGVIVILVVGVLGSLFIERRSIYQRTGEGEYRSSKSAMAIRSFEAVIQDVAVKIRLK